VALDPAFAAAHLRLAITSRYLVDHASHEIFKRAVTLRSSLGERDLMILGAYEPLLLRDPPDTKEAVRRLRAAWEAHPGDIEIPYLIASLRTLPPPEEVFEITGRMLALEPQSASALHLKAAALRNLGELDESLKVADQCLAVSPSSSACLYEKGVSHMIAGRCDRYEEDTRLHLLTDPSSTSSYQDRAMSLHALKKPTAAIQATLEQGWSFETDARRMAVRLYDEGRLAVAEGRLEEGARALREAIRAAATDPTEMQHLRPTLVLVELEEEMGRLSEASDVAGEFLTSRDAWRRAMNQAVWKDSTMRLLSVRLRAGAISKEEHAERRAAWLLEWTDRLSGSSRFAAWLYGYAYPAETPDEAKEALRALPELSTSAPLLGVPLADALMGKVYLLAGRPEEALPYLKSAVARCDALGNPIQHTLAAHRLGRAHEAQGQKAEACSAYAIVLDRWSRSKASVTAKAAAERAKALGCSR
jgi:tetratricopeptide (TPR) repeat protein